ncbi:MAG: HNH endonuclease [Bdellovibrionales bacterium]
MEPSKFSDDELLESLEERFAIERDNSHHILLHLKEIQTRRLFAKRGFSNMFSMLIKHFRQSETSANQHLKALDLMLAVPVVEERLISGDLNLSTLAMAQRQIKREEKLTGKKIAQAKKAEIIESITNKTMAQTETELFKLLPETASNPPNSERRISEDATRMNLTVPDDVRDMMIRLKELWAHADPTMDNVEVMRRAFKLALAKADPTQTKVDPNQKSKRAAQPTSVKHRGNDRLKYYGKEYDRALWERAGSRCEFVDKKTGRRCDCKFGLEKEHVIPLGKGGTNELSNMQLLCRPHNQLRARQAYGDSKINRHQQKAGDQDDRTQWGV